MPQIQLTDSLYQDARRRAAAAGFASVDEYVAQVVSEALAEVPNDDHLFTPDRLAHLDQISAAIDAGEETLTPAYPQLGQRVENTIGLDSSAGQAERSRR